MSLDQWETYYRGGTIATCPTAADGGYDREVREAWVEFFSVLPDQARILDVGTGNGVVALIAAETATARGRHWEIHATDLAKIDPIRYVSDGARRLAGITFHPGVATEDLPFDDESFDAVSGHYALEYAPIGAAMAQIHRVLKSDGNAQFIIHHADSLLVRSARRSLLEAELVFGQTKIFKSLHRLVTMDPNQADAIDAATAELRAGIHTLKQGLQQATQEGGGRILSVALDAVQKLLTARKEIHPQAVGQEVDRAQAEMRASVRRLNDLLAHARSDQDMDEIQKQAAAAGFDQIERVPQYYDGNNLVGWQLLLHRP